jgi:nicotinamidase-related amidase
MTEVKTKPLETVLLVIDMQNDMLHKKGTCLTTGKLEA